MTGSHQHDGAATNDSSKAEQNVLKPAVLKRSALILYGSETGNSHDVAKELGHLTERHRFDTTVTDFDSIEIEELVKHSVVIVAISTTGQGEFPQNGRTFWQLLLSAQLKAGVLKRVVFTSFGLGDSSYPQYNVASRMLHARLVQLGARAFCARGEGNEQHPEGHSAGFRVWMPMLSQSLTEVFPLPEGQTVIPEDVFVEPQWKLDLAAPIANGNFEHSTGRSDGDSVAEAPDHRLVPVRDSVSAKIMSNHRMTPTSHEQDVRLLELSINEQIGYGPGAVAVVYPKNFPTDVQHFVDLMDWQSMADVPLRLVRTSDNKVMVRSLTSSPLAHINTDSYGQHLTLRTLLTDHLDIMSIPRRYFFCSLANFARESTEDERYQKERLLELANPELIDELWDYTTRPRRTILEVMQDFATIKIPWQYALNVLPIMRGRQFSIGSGGSLKQGADTQLTSVQLLVAIANPPNPIIKYRKRHGVCTRYIAMLQPGQDISVTIQRGYLNLGAQSAKTPAVLIGPGTGVAPLRSLIYERLGWVAQEKSRASATWLGDCILFFGCRSSTADLFFDEEWQYLTREHGLIVHTALSREPGRPRQYVQDLVKRQAQQVYNALVVNNGMVFVCGSSGDMPRGVRQALLDVLELCGGENHEDGHWAEQYLDQMEKQGRYKQETW